MSTIRERLLSESAEDIKKYLNKSISNNDFIVLKIEYNGIDLIIFLKNFSVYQNIETHDNMTIENTVCKIYQIIHYYNNFIQFIDDNVKLSENNEFDSRKLMFPHFTCGNETYYIEFRNDRMIIIYYKFATFYTCYNQYDLREFLSTYCSRYLKRNFYNI